jgi:hypothetical protein
VLAVATALLAATALHPAFAQSTDGYHAVQVFPLVVDSGSFAQRFAFRNPDAANPVTIAVGYFPGTGVVPSTAVACPEVVVPPLGSTTATSLRALCPGIGDGSQFGFVRLTESSGANRPFAAFSRVSNPAGNGFTVEAFPAHTFTSADAVVTGIRRLGATPSTPAFQTNCFIGDLNEVSPDGADVPTTVDYSISDNAGNVLATASTIVHPGQLVRLLDVFGAAGLATGDYNDATIKFEELGSGEPGLLTYCTVQDNSSFGADFRIAKQEGGYSTPYSSVGAQDDHVTRDAAVGADLGGADGALRECDLPAGDFSNSDVGDFRHPDYVQCELLDAGVGAPVSAEYGLELRLLDQDGQVLAGGNGATGFGEVFLGDKQDRNDGANTRYTLQVESSGVNTTAIRPYRLRCQSGSGHTLGDITRYHAAGTSF